MSEQHADGVGVMLRRAYMAMMVEKAVLIMDGQVVYPVLGIKAEEGKEIFPVLLSLNWEDNSEFVLDEDPEHELFRNLLAVPLRRDGQIVGVLCVLDKKYDQPFDQGDPRLLQFVSIQLKALEGCADATDG